jgi:hypothetical protein
MKKSSLYTGFTFLLIGLLFGIFALFSNTKLESQLWGFSGAGVAGGSVGLWKYYFWSHPKNKIKYKDRLENETIELCDERKEKFRNQSGRYAYIVGLGITCISIVIFSLLESLEIIHHTKILILYLFGYFVFQYIVGIIIFWHLNKKY